MDFKVGDRVVSLGEAVAGTVKEGEQGTIAGVDEGDALPYLVRWDNDPDEESTWMYAEEIEAVPRLYGKTTPPELPDAVNHPAHYNTGKIEVIDFIEDQGLEYHEANAIKYITRAGKKNPDTRIEDLEKAVWYLNRKIALLKGENDG